MVKMNVLSKKYKGEFSMKKRIIAAFMAGTLVFSLNSVGLFAAGSIEDDYGYTAKNETVVVDNPEPVKASSGAITYAVLDDASLTINGDLNAEADGKVQAGLFTSAYEGYTASTVINGDLIVTGTGVHESKKKTGVIGVYAQASSGGVTDIDVEGDIVATATGNGIQGVGVELLVTTASAAKARVGGDISGNLDCGAMLAAETGAKVDLVVEGTIGTGNYGAIAFMVDPEAINIVAWEVEADKAGNLVNECVYEIIKDKGKVLKGVERTEAAEELEKNINYILKVDPEKNDNIKLGVSKTTFTAANGQTYDYYTAKEGEEVTFTITAPDGFDVEKAYCKSGVTVTKNANGTYSFKVPKGGAVLIGADFILITTTPLKLYNPNEILGTKATLASFSKVYVSIEEQGEAAKAAFNNALPAGWTQLYSFDIFADGNTDHARKNGKFGFDVPTQYQKTGRQYAVLGIDKNGNVKQFKNNSAIPGRVEIDLDIEGYAFELICKD